MANCTMCIKFDECPWRSDPNSYCSAYEQRELTKADQIRSMSDEELAEWIVHKTEGNGFDGYEAHVKAWLDWLRQEASDD